MQTHTHSILVCVRILQGHMVNRRFRTHSKDLEKTQKRISYLESIFLELWKYRREKLQQR